MKIISSLLLLMPICLFITGCDNKRNSEMQSETHGDIQRILEQGEEFTQQMKENGLNWSVEEWKSHIKEVDRYSLLFWESNPSAKDVEIFDNQNKEYGKALDEIFYKVSDILRIARNQLGDDEDFVKVRKAIKETAKKVRKRL